MAEITVLLADDHSLVRAGIRALIDAQPDMRVVGEVGDVDELLRAVVQSHPEIVILDITMPGGGGMQAQQKLLRAAPGTKILFLTMHRDSAYIRTTMGSGASGYVTKSAAHTELLQAIRTVAAGKRYIDSTVSALLLPQEERRSGLTPREEQTLRLIVAGHTNQEIADKLFISVKTVETYRANILNKLELKTRAEMVQYAINAGLLRDSE